MLTIHHLGMSQSERILWLCEELDLPYALKRYARDPQTGLAPAEYKALHPLGTAPVITDGATVMAESGAIMEYILGRYGHGQLAVGPAEPNFADYVFWFNFANGSFVPSQMMAMFARAIPVGDNRAAELISGRSKRAWSLVEERLGQAPYFAGEAFTAADIIMGFSLTTMRAFAPAGLDDYPNVRGYLQRIGERPAYRRAMEKGEPGFAPMLA